MPANPQKFSFVLSGGMDNRNMDDLISPTVQHGSAPHVALSRNTRFGVVPGRVVRAPAASAFDTNADRRPSAFVSESLMRRSVYIGHPEEPVFGSSARAISDRGNTPFGAGSFDLFPGEQRYLGAASARPFGGVAAAHGRVAMAYNAHTGVLWRCYLESALDTYSARLEGFIGGALVLRTTVTGVGATAGVPWIGLTCHGATYDVAVWRFTTAGALVVTRVTRVGTTAGFSTSASSVITPGANTFGLDVAAVSETQAVVVYPSPADADDARISLVTMSTGAITTSIIEVGALAAGGHARVIVGQIGADTRIVAAYTQPGANTAFAKIYSSALSAFATSSSFDCRGRAEIAFLRESANAGFVLATDDVYGAPPAHPLVTLRFLGSVANVPGIPYIIYARALTGHTCTMGYGSTRFVPVFGMIRRWGFSDDGHGEQHFVDDPALELWWVTEALSASSAPFARLGCPRGVAAPIDYYSATRGPASSAGLVFVDSEIHAVYTKYDGREAVPAVRGARHSVVAVDRVHKTVANDRDGPGMVACAMPLHWDGVTLTPMGSPVEAPHVYTQITTGTAKLAAGAYGILAVFEWTDAAGLVHRSRPSTPVSVSMNGSTNLLTVRTTGSPPGTTYQASVKLYMTDTNGSSYHLLAEAVANPQPRQFSNVDPVSVASEQIYTTGQFGEELGPQPPPPAADVAVVADRCWILDAEIPSRYVYSKRRSAGTAFEFHPAFEILLPSGAGRGVAVRQIGGLVILIAERGVFQVSGEGPPNSLGGGGSFGAPVKISDIGCSNRASVVEYPDGIMWQDRERFVRMSSAGGIAYDRVFGCTHDVSAACVLSRYQEILFFSDTTAEIRVYNYELDRWSVWDSQVLSGAAAVRTAHTFPADPDYVLTWSDGASRGSYLDAESVSAAANMVVETGWVAPGGDFQDDCELDHVVINGRHDGGNHAITARILADYDETNAVPERTISNASMAALGTGKGGRYSWRMEPTAEGGVRVFKLRLTDARVSGAGMDTRHVTVVFRRENILREDAFAAGSDA